jgi:hypothetical protein
MADPRAELEELRRLEALEAKARASVAGKKAPGMFVPSGEKGLPIAEIIAGNPVTRFAAGAASPFMGIAQGVEKALETQPAVFGPAAIPMLVGKVVSERLGAPSADETVRSYEDLKKRGMELSGDKVDVAGIAGQVLSPAVLAATRLAGPASAMGKIGQGAVLGGVFGGATPVTEEGDFGSQKLAQAGLGAGVGAAIPAVTVPLGMAGRAAYRTVAPLTSGRRIRGGLYLDAAGDKADEVIANLRANRQIVPGSLPTAGEAAAPAGRAEFAALQRAAADIMPSEYGARVDAQNAARLAALRTVGKDKAAVAAAEAGREAAAGPLYAAARTGTAPIDTAGVRSKIDAMLRDNPGNRELVNELSRLKRGLVDKGIPRERAQEVASALDGLKAALAKEDNKFITGQLTSIKEMLSDAIPGYRQAQQVFAEKSAPINQMKVGQYLETKLRPALDEMGRQRPEAFAQAVQDAPGTLMKRSGVPLSKPIQDVLTPEQMRVVEGVQSDLARMQRFGTLAQRGMKAAPDLSAAVQGKLINPLHRGIMVMNALITRLEGKINKKVAADIAAEMLNPPQVAETMAQAAKRRAQNEAVSRTLEKMRIGATAGGVAAVEQ